MRGCFCCVGMMDAAGADIGAGARRRHAYRTIDVHCHLVTPEVEEAVRTEPGWAAWNERMVHLMGAESLRIARDSIASLTPQLTDIDVRLAEMDAMGVDVQVLSPAPHQYHYWAGPELADRLVHLQNTRIAETCAARPDRFLGFGALALQHPDLAVTQLEAAVTTYGLKGVEISTSVGGVEFSDPRFEPLWAKAEALGAVIFLHPIGSGVGERIRPYYLSNIIGQPIETTIALSHLIFSGTLDRHPGLKLCAAHGGGYLPAYAGRSDHGYVARPECGVIALPPSAYLNDIYFDSVVHSPKVLASLIAQVGVSQVVVGTDYPFDMGHYEIQALLEGVEGLDRAGQKAIFGANAERMLGL